MEQVTISLNKRYFIRGGKPFFFLADTIWFAFSRLDMEEWEEYIGYRCMQGFNALQISILPILNEISLSELDIKPFLVNPDGKFDFSSINTEYFERAAAMLEKACEKGMLPILAPLWVNYIPGSWAAAATEGNQMPLNCVKPYVEYISKIFRRFNPLYIVSGDTKFETEEIGAYYLTILEALRANSPESLATMHTAPAIELPEAFCKDNVLDFYMYQSGHAFEHQSLSYKSAASFLAKQPPKPILNGEPCYEGSGYGFQYGRFNEFDVRKAMWWSLLSGAKAGFAYGAHGVWGLYKKGEAFRGEAFSGTPFDWKLALKFKGAWDASFGKTLFENYGLYDIEPVYKILDKTDEIRMAATADWSKIVIYSPFNVNISVDMDLSGYDFIFVELSGRNFAKPVIMTEDGKSIIRMHDFNSDVLFIGKKSQIHNYR